MLAARHQRQPAKPGARAHCINHQAEKPNRKYSASENSAPSAPALLAGLLDAARVVKAGSAAQCVTSAISASSLYGADAQGKRARQCGTTRGGSVVADEEVGAPGSARNDPRETSWAIVAHGLLRHLNPRAAASGVNQRATRLRSLPRMKIHFLGAADTVTSSRHLVELDGQTILLDCGLFQGFKTSRWILSHAHD